MSDERFDIIFRGDILPGHQLIEVKARLKQLFKADDARVNALFGGGVTPLKRNLDSAAAEKYRSVLSKAGADIQVSPAGKVQARQAPVRAKAQGRARPEVQASAAGAKPMTLKERLEAQESGPHAEEVVQKAIDPDDSGWTMAAVGSDLLDTAERETVVPAVVNVPALSLRPSVGGLLDDNERVNVEPVAVDVSGLSLDEVGADLLMEAEKSSVAEREVDTSAMGLAPAGSDLGQIKDERPKLDPDISGLSLEE